MLREIDSLLSQYQYRDESITQSAHQLLKSVILVVTVLFGLGYFIYESNLTARPGLNIFTAGSSGAFVWYLAYYASILLAAFLLTLVAASLYVLLNGWEYSPATSPETVFDKKHSFSVENIFRVKLSDAHRLQKRVEKRNRLLRLTIRLSFSLGIALGILAFFAYYFASMVGKGGTESLIPLELTAVIATLAFIVLALVFLSNRETYKFLLAYLKDNTNSKSVRRVAGWLLRSSPDRERKQKGE